MMENWFSEMLWFVFVTIGLHFGMVCLLSGFYGFIDHFSLFQGSRFQKKSSHSNPNLTDCIAVLFKNIFIYDLIGLPIIYLALKQRVTFTGPLPMWSEIIVHIPLCIIVEDTLFYWIHRLLHTPFLYKNLHKMHHQYHQPIALSFQYTHPIENFMTAGIPLFTGPLLLGSHVYTVWLWMCIRITESMDGHSGYDLWFMPFRYFPFRPGAQVHDYHHSHNVGNYGSFFTLWDKFCGTDHSFKAYKKQ